MDIKHDDSLEIQKQSKHMHKGIYLIMMTNTNSQKKTQGFKTFQYTYR